jgi:hypothetical protein
MFSSFLNQLFDRDGMFQHKFHVPDLKASTLAVDENRRIVVADSANRCIHVISLDTGKSAWRDLFVTVASKKEFIYTVHLEYYRNFFNGS